MIPEQIPQLTIPLSPLLQPGETTPRQSKRMRPEDALDLRSAMMELEKSRIFSFGDQEKSWSVVAVYSPYSPDVHVMVIETHVHRYLPGPEWISDSEGNALMDIWTSILEFVAEREESDTIYVGYNWSPRAWGKEEEKTGLQSIPTKWHAMIWVWPPFPKSNEKSQYAEWIEFQSLSPNIQRLMGKNTYAVSFCQLILQRLESAFPEGSQFVELFPPEDWRNDERSIYVDFDGSVLDILRTQEFFSQVLKPMAIVMEGLMRELTEAFTDLDCRFMDRILLKTEQGPLDKEDLQKLREPPKLRSMDEIRTRFEESKLPECLLEDLLAPVRNRCLEVGDPADWWRKGFGYALVLSGSAKEKIGKLRIMPGVYVGPGGVVEAQGVVLRRPEHRSLSQSEIEKKSRALWQLAKKLKKGIC